MNEKERGVGGKGEVGLKPWNGWVVEEERKGRNKKVRNHGYKNNRREGRRGSESGGKVDGKEGWGGGEGRVEEKGEGREGSRKEVKKPWIGWKRGEGGKGRQKGKVKILEERGKEWRVEGRGGRLETMARGQVTNYSIMIQSRELYFSVSRIKHGRRRKGGGRGWWWSAGL